MMQATSFRVTNVLVTEYTNGIRPFPGLDRQLR